MVALACVKLPDDFGQDSTGSISLFDAAIDLFGEGIELAADQRAAQAQHDQHDNDLRHEGQGRFLNLGQRLKLGDDYADVDRGADSGARADQNRPDRQMQNVQRVSFVHRRVRKS